MSDRTFKVSDLTGEIIQDLSNLVTVVVLDHPTIERPVQLDSDRAELAVLESGTKDFVLLELLSDGGDKRERLVLELPEFEKLFKTGEDVQDILEHAEPFGYDRVVPEPVHEPQPKRRGRPAGSGTQRTAVTAGEKVNYKELPHAGLEHRGRVSPEEAELVRNNLDEVNRNRVAAGQAPIDPADAKMSARYGFDQMKAEDRPKLAPEFKS